MIEMRQCPYCGRWFKNRFSLMSHLKYCPLKISKANKEIVTEVFTYKGWKFVVKGEKGFYDVIKRVHSRAKEKGWDTK